MQKSSESEKHKEVGRARKLSELKEKIATAKGSKNNRIELHSKHKNINYAWRMILELVIGMLLGVGIGVGLDHLLGTAPLMIVLMSLFGFGAGVRTMMKTAAEFSPVETKDEFKE